MSKTIKQFTDSDTGYKLTLKKEKKGYQLTEQMPSLLRWTGSTIASKQKAKKAFESSLSDYKNIGQFLVVFPTQPEEPVVLHFGQYVEPKHTAITAKSLAGASFATLTVNVLAPQEDHQIALKTYSENRNLEITDTLIRFGIIERQCYGVIRSGHIVIPLYNLSERGLHLQQLQQEKDNAKG